ncbi:hypothetical protein SAMN04488564_109301 [Lentzea waywayandensis]|uniref:Uncharacterized protein n=1 Tax=Lentzea waywayandensis TaxID=84724 RepID=A0A1I6F8W6_9PSEU|nr:hypothetical protein [Lentzea waywayandensis]SFR26207.1 hypothetical protein SAMN04488564_109301 [Lentzea waywayandensis]
MVELPAPLAQLAAERGLGPCDHRFRRRVTLFTVLGLVAAAAVVFLLLTLTAAPLIILSLPVLIALLLLHRRRGAGLYLFDGGLVVVSGWTAPRVVTWEEAQDSAVRLNGTYEDFQRAATIIRSRASSRD